MDNPYESPDSAEASSKRDATRHQFRSVAITISVLLAVDVAVLAFYWLPGLFGYVGSERFEWTGLVVGVIGLPLAAILTVVLIVLRVVSLRVR